MQIFPRHEWVIAPFRADRDAAPRNPSAERYDIDAHRNLGGPYTAGGQLVRCLMERARVLTPDLLTTHQLTLLSVAPDLANQVPVSDKVAQWFSFSREGSPRSWTLRLAHGLTEFLLSYAARVPARRLSVSFENVDWADPLDREFLAVLLRRADPERLAVRVGSSSDQLEEPLLSALKTYASTTHLEPVAPIAVAAIPDAWRSWLKQCAAGWAGEWMMLLDLSRYLDLSATRASSSGLEYLLDDAIERVSPIARSELANEYVRTDCVLDSLIARRAYAGITAAERNAHHRARAAELEELHRARATKVEGLDHSCFSLGAIPFHHEQGGGDAAPLLAASKHCMHFAYYEASLDWALRGRRMLPPANEGKTYSEFSRNILFSLLLLGRLREVEVICAEILSRSQDPALLAHTTYANAILNARLYELPRRDYAAAKAWVEKSQAYTEMLPPSETRAVNLAFLRNTMALVEMRTGNLHLAHELLSAALDYMAKEAPGKYDAECAILLHNRARLHIARKQVGRAIEDLTTLLRHHPAESEAYFDRGVLHQRSGRYEEALRDYDAAVQWSPPYTEVHFNRAQTLVSLGRKEAALADYSYILTLAPGHLEALIHRACLLYDLGDFDASRTDVETGLRINHAQARLLCLRGLLEIKEGHLDRAYEAFTKSIEADPLLPDPWANRATVLFKRGDLDGSSLDLTRALNLREDASMFYNRGRVFEAQRKWAQAIEDYSRALQLTKGDVQHILLRRSLCEQASESARMEADVASRSK